MSSNKKPAPTAQPDEETIARVLKSMKEKGISLDQIARYQKKVRSQKKRMTPKQVERVLVSNRREKLREVCRKIAVLGHAHLYLSVAGDKVVLTGDDQLRSVTRPFNKRGFGSAKHPIGAKGASDIGKAKARKKPFLARIDPEKRREIARKGGLAAAKKRADHRAKIAARGPHWTQKPENRERVRALLARAEAAKKAKTAPSAHGS